MANTRFIERAAILTLSSMIAATAVGAGMGPFEQVDLTSADQVAIREAAEAWVARYNAGDAVGVANLYSEDGYYASAHILAHGRGEIERYWARGIAAGGHLDFVQPVEIHAEGDLGYFLGKYQATNAGVTVEDAF